MELLAMIKGLSLVTILKGAAISIGGVLLIIPVLDIVYKIIDEVILFIDHKIINKVPFKAVKKMFERRLVGRITQRIERYKEIIAEIRK